MLPTQSPTHDAAHPRRSTRRTFATYDLLLHSDRHSQITTRQPTIIHNAAHTSSKEVDDFHRQSEMRFWKKKHDGATTTTLWQCLARRSSAAPTTMRWRKETMTESRGRCWQKGGGASPYWQLPELVWFLPALISGNNICCIFIDIHLNLVASIFLIGSRYASSLTSAWTRWFMSAPGHVITEDNAWPLQGFWSPRTIS